MARPHTPRGERTIPVSTTGRLYWRPGDPHPLDILAKELDTLSAQLPTALTSLLAAAQQAMHHLQAVLDIERQHDPTAPFNEADQRVWATVAHRFASRKHQRHLQLIFALKRRQRLLGRLRAIRAALDLANGLLAEEETLSADVLSSVQQQTTKNTNVRQDKPVLSHYRRKQSILSMSHRNHRSRKRRCACNIWSNHSLPWSVRSHARDNCCASLKRNSQRCGPIWLRAMGALKSSWSPNVAINRKSSLMATPCSHWNGMALPLILRWNAPSIRRLPATLMQQRLPFPPEMRDKVDDLHSLGPYAKYRWWDGPQHDAISLGPLEDDPPFPFIPDGFSHIPSTGMDASSSDGSPSLSATTDPLLSHPLSLTLNPHPTSYQSASAHHGITRELGARATHHHHHHTTVTSPRQ
jgi:hypothetical protein